jgi:hypothetical protein
MTAYLGRNHGRLSKSIIHKEISQWYSSRHRLLIKLVQAEKEIGFLHKSCMFKWQIAIHRHSPRLIPNQYQLSDPPNFSLLSTFKIHSVYSRSCIFPLEQPSMYYIFLFMLYRTSGVLFFLSTTAQLHVTHRKGGRRRKRHSSSTR